MVSDRVACASASSRDRAQIILIGAIALAFIILGVVVVFNGVLYTETISSSATSQSASDATVTQHELERGIAGIVHRENIDTGASYNIDEYAKLFQNVTASGGAIITDIEEGTNPSTDATVATGDTNSTELNTDNISADGNDVYVGHLRFEIEDFDGGSIEVDNSERTVTIDGTTVDSTPAHLDLVDGTINGTPHEDLQLFDPGTGYDEVTIDADSSVVGEYELVTKGEDSLDDRFDRRGGAWAIEATVTYESNDVSFEQTYDVPVYGVIPDG